MTALDGRWRAAFTLVELMMATAVFSIFMAGLLGTWRSLTFTSLNTTAYTQRQNDQMRVLDYMKRDLRRATQADIYNGGALVTGTTTFGTELRLTLPDYYADTREEDNAIGTKNLNPPTVAGGVVSYGTALTVRYYVINGAPVRNAAGVIRPVGHANGAFALSFKRETSGAVRCRVIFNQPMRGGATRSLRRQVDALGLPRPVLQQ